MTLDLISTAPAVSIQLPQWAVALLVVGFLFISIVMILIVLIQRPQGGGLSGAFGAGGGSGAGQTAFGARTGDALTISTITIFVLYLLAAIFLNYTIAPPTADDPSAIPAAQMEGEADDSTTFTEPEPAAPAPTETEDIDANAPVGPMPEIPADSGDAPADDAATDEPSDG